MPRSDWSAPGVQRATCRDSVSATDSYRLLTKLAYVVGCRLECRGLSWSRVMHIRCPHCHNAVEVVGTEDFASVQCPSCGSSFDLLPPTKSFWLSKRTIGHFELLEQLGTGGFGTVWKARDTKLDRL